MARTTQNKKKKLTNGEISELNKTAFNTMGDLYLLTDKDFNIVDANDTFCKKVGMTRTTLRKLKAPDLGGDVSIEKLRTYQTMAMEKPILFNFKYKLGNDKFQEFEVQYTAVNVKGALYFASVSREITEFSNLQQELKESNERFELISGATMEGLWEVNFASGAKWANDTHQKFYGLTSHDAVPPPAAWESRIHPSDRKRIVEGQDAAIKKRITKWNTEYWFNTHNKDYIYIYDRALFFYDKSGKLEKMMGSMVDVTALKKAQEQIQDQKDLSESIINSLPGAFYLISREGKFLRWNKNFEKITGYSAEEISNIHPQKFFNGKGGKILLEKVQEVFELGQAELEGDLLTKSGVELPFYFTGWRTFIGNQECLIGFGMDMSEIKKAQESIKKMERALSDQRVRDQKNISRAIINAQERERNYIGRELHDNVNQLLAGARLYLSMAAKQNSEMADLIKYPIELLDDGIREIRALTHKNITPSIDKDLKQLAEGIISLLETVPIKTSLKYSLQRPIDDDILINVYRILQEQANNIIKHSKAKTANLDISEEGQNLIIIIEDNGVGFNVNEYRDGVGLYNISSRVEAYDGHVEITSSPGHGCKTIIRIPVFQEKRGKRAYPVAR